MSVASNSSGNVFRLLAHLTLWGVMIFAAGCGETVSKGNGSASAEEASQKETVAKGQQLFARNGCPLCHGEEGRGDGKIARTLKPDPRNFRDLAAYKQGTGVEEMVKTIKNGIAGGSTMPAYPHLSEKESRLIATFIKYLQEQSRSPGQ